MVSFGSGSGRRSKLTYGGRRRGSGSASKARETTPPASRSDKEDETPQAKRVKVKGSDGKGKGTALSGHGGHGKVSDGDVVVDQRGTATTRPSVGKAAAGPASTLGRSKASSSKAGDDSDSSLTDYDEAEVPAPASARAQGSAARKAASSKATKSKHASPVTLNKPTKKTKLSPSASAALAPAVELASHRPSPAKATVASVAHPPLASPRSRKAQANESRPRTPPPASRPVSRPATPNVPSGSTPVPVTPRAQQARQSHRAPESPRTQPADLSDIFARIAEPSKPGTSTDKSKPRQSRIAQMGSRSNTKPTVSSSPSLSSLGSTTPRRTAGLGMTHSAPELGSPSLSHVSRSPTRSILGSPSRSLSRNASAAELGGAPLVAPMTLDFGVLSGASNGRTRTYGGLQRSFLPDEDNLDLARDDVEMQDARPEEVAKGRLPKRFNAFVQPKARESYADLRRKWGIDQDEEDSDLAAGSSFDLRTLAQQRSSGSSKRFLDELSYLFEGLSPSEDLSARRSSALQLSRHLLDADFLGRLRVHGLLERVYDALRAARGHPIDKVVQACLAFFVATLCLEQRLAEPVLRIPPVAEPGQELDPLTTDSDCLRVLGAMLASPAATDGFAQEPGGKGSAKIERMKMAELADIIGKSSLRRHVQARLSLSSLVLFSLAAISTFDVRPGLRPQHAVVKSGAFGRVTDFLTGILSKLEDRINGFSRGMDLLPPGFGADLQALDFCISVVETCTTCDEGALLVLGSASGSLAPGFVSLLTVCNVLAARVDDPTQATLALNILTGSLRSLINVTNMSEEWLDRLCDARVVKTISNLLDICRARGPGLVDGSSNASGQDGLAFDTLCVALALLANIAEHGESGRRLLLDTKAGPSCSPLKRKCAQACACEDASSALGSIVRLCADPLDFCPTEEEKQFVKAYGGALLTLAMVGDDEAQDQVVRGLAEAGAKDIDGLIDSIGELAGQQEGETQGDEAKLRSLQASLRARWERA